MKKNRLSVVILTLLVTFFQAGAAVGSSANTLPVSIESKAPSRVVDIDEVEGLSQPIFGLGVSEESYDPADDEINTAALISQEQAQRFLDSANERPNGFLWIRAYIGKKYDSGFPNHSYDGVDIQKEFMTVTWFKFGRRLEWDAFPISSGKHHKSEGKGAWTQEGNFSIVGRMGRYHTSSIYGSAMPYALDHDGVKKIHVGDVKGYPASHGCVRVPSNGKWTAEGGKNKGYLLDKLVSKIGMSNVLVSIYRQKPELTNEVNAKKILERMNAPVDISELSFYGL